jgi:hypothetical protein
MEYYCDVLVTNKTGSSLDDWIYYQLVTYSLVITLKYRQYSAISHLQQLQFTITHTLGFSVPTSCFPATALNAQTATVTLQLLHTKKVLQSHSKSSHIMATNFPLLLPFTCNSHF